MPGCGYGVLALALLIVGSRRHRALSRALERGEPAPLTATTVTLFTVGGVVLATVTTVVVLALVTGLTGGTSPVGPLCCLAMIRLA